MARLSVVIITKNEAANLARCLSSVRFADEIIVVDSHSSDQTVEIARSHGALVIPIDWPGFGPAKQLGVDRAIGEWVLSIDADEELSSGLAAEIQQCIASPSTHAGYEMPRRTQFLGRWIGHCGWYPDHLLRLFKRDHGRVTDAKVHEQIVVNGSIGRFRNDLLHYSYPTIDVYLVKFDRYTSVGAEEAFQRGRRTGLFDLTIRPMVAFLKFYIAKRGFLDGYEGFLISVFSAGAVLVKYAKLRDLQRLNKLGESA